MHIYSPLKSEALTASSRLPSSTTRHRVQITRRYIPGDSKTSLVYCRTVTGPSGIYVFPQLSQLGMVILDSGSE